MTEVAGQREDLSFDSINQNQQTVIFGDEQTSIIVNNYTKPNSQTSQGIVLFQMEQRYSGPPPMFVRRARYDRYTQMHPLDKKWFAKAAQRQFAVQSPQAFKKKVMYREKQAVQSATSVKKQSHQSISATVNSIIHKKEMTSRAIQTGYVEKIDCFQPSTHTNALTPAFNTLNEITNRNEPEMQFAAKGLAVQSEQRCQASLNESKKSKQPSSLQNNCQKQVTNTLPSFGLEQENEIKLIELPKASAITKKKSKKSSKVQNIIFSSKLEQQQQPFLINQSHNSLQTSKFNLNQRFNAGFLRGESLMQQLHNQSDEGVITTKVNMRFKGSILVLKIKSFTLSLGKQKIEVKLHKTEQGHYQCDSKYKSQIEILQNVYHGRKVYANEFKKASFTLFKMRLPARLQSFFEVGLEDVSNLKLQIGIVTITCFCKHRFSSAISSGVSCSKVSCSEPSSIIFDSFVIQ